MSEPIFTDFRREQIARTIFDVLKIVIAAAFASKFFFEFHPLVKIAMGLLMIALVVSGIGFCPRKKPKE